ncbi:MAG: imidazolonepropionase [Bacteroidales bacterium]|nr:imidazolonepropionase [Bacteroidales bacterium]
MGKIIIQNIKKIISTERVASQTPLCGEQMASLECIEGGYIILNDDIITEFGEMNSLNSCKVEGARVIEASGKMVMPTFCDSHTHLVYAGSREMEYRDKIKGLTYQEIAARGGGILNSAKLLHTTSEDELYRQSLDRAYEILRFGTGAVEIKSGYGLTAQDEIKMLRVAKRIGDSTPLTVRTTFLGAHAVPERFSGRREEYVDEIIHTMIPMIAAEDLADYIDVFTERGFFTVEDTDRIFNAGMKYGMRAKIHANQMSNSGAVRVASKYNAISADHLEFTGPEEFRSLKESGTIATLLPGSTFFLEMEYAPARAMLSYGLPVALATNYNPGSSPAGDMKFIMAIAALKMKMTPEEVINASTINGAFAMGIGESHGSIAVGKKANLVITRAIPSYEYIPYALTAPIVDTLILDGRELDINAIR